MPATLAASAVFALLLAAPCMAQQPSPNRVPNPGWMPPPATGTPVPVPHTPPPPLPAVNLPSGGNYTAQPVQPPDDPMMAQKKQDPIKPVPEEFVKLPPRESIFMVYDDKELERAIMDSIRKDLKKEKKYDPGQEKYLVFPALPVIGTPGVPYQPKTYMYEARQVILEPGFVVHRRLHFEERNAERAGWDFGPLQGVVSTVYFWKDAITFPQSLMTGCVRGAWDTSAGKCLPGSPTPYFLYPPGLTLTGTVFEGGVITAAAFLFP